MASHRITTAGAGSGTDGTSAGSLGPSKMTWHGHIVAIQPRIRLTRSFDERGHTYQGYTLAIDGTIDGEPGVFVIAIGKAAQASCASRHSATPVRKCDMLEITRVSPHPVVRPIQAGRTLVRPLVFDNPVAKAGLSVS